MSFLCRARWQRLQRLSKSSKFTLASDWVVILSRSKRQDAAERARRSAWGMTQLIRNGPMTSDTRGVIQQRSRVLHRLALDP